MIYQKVNEPLVEYGLANSITVTKYTIDRLLRNEHSSELIALYVFYAYTSNWQKTNQPKCTTNYVAKGLGWSDRKVQMYKKILIDMKLVEDVVRKDDKGKIKGWYIKLHYVENRGNSHGAKTEPVENLHPNSLNY
jgi:hypothetical protein